MLRPRTADVVVIGGGLVGCATARVLAHRASAPWSSSAGGSAARPAAPRPGWWRRRRNATAPGPLLQAGLASRRRYARFVAAIEDESGIDVEYRRDGVVYVALVATAARRLVRRMRWQRAAGLRVARITTAEARRRARVRGPGVRLAVHFPDEHRVNNPLLTAAAAAAARRAGVRILEETATLAVAAAQGRVVGVRTARGAIVAPVVVDAAGAWAAEILLAAAHAMAPGLAGAALESTYAGLRPATVGGRPVVGPATDLQGLVYATMRPGSIEGVFCWPRWSPTAARGCRSRPSDRSASLTAARAC